MLKTEERLPATGSGQLRELYNNYGDMLFGYIFEIVKDKELAEQYLLKVFADISKQTGPAGHEALNTWAQVFRHAKCWLGSVLHPENDHASCPSATSRYKESHPALLVLNDQERKIFCDAYYYGKTIDAIAIELNQPEALIRKTLRQAFITIRNGSGN